MSRKITSTVYLFDELSDSAKENARAWFREVSRGGDDISEYVYENIERMAEIIGIKIDRRHNSHCPAIYYSGFWSQGDGAYFEGAYAYAKGAAKAIRSEAPQDTTLHDIADRLHAAQRRCFYRATAAMAHRGYYHYHSGCMAVDVSDCNESADIEDAITQCMRDFADWMYNHLKTEYEYQNADEQVDESIRGNKYEFTEEGERA